MNWLSDYKTETRQLAARARARAIFTGPAVLHRDETTELHAWPPPISNIHQCSTSPRRALLFLSFPPASGSICDAAPLPSFSSCAATKTPSQSASIPHPNPRKSHPQIRHGASCHATLRLI
ncbi:hypothetical protein BT67DRAFT_152119 [Trichocladium antarcticum]|uniref:Uncharacterized protein n=1 Tax=Trichocladium antarcticum TaxID=1450529 RepID=A0AAN6UEZ2_9PEZI|nr:hypothetical protein BT67DRAFT_152119 [Trichocladium antarcticum]